MNTRSLIVALLFLVALLAVLNSTLAPVHQMSDKQVIQQSHFEPWEEETRWGKRIVAVGGSRAYEEFASAVSDMSPRKRHKRAHAFGSALYAVDGIPAFSVCDARFSYGCFHEFLGRAIADKGLSVVTQLNEECVNAFVSSPFSCQHGIGHGIFAALGYTFPDLLKALEICNTLSSNSPIGGCLGGIFMEYNFQTMLGNDGQLRTPSADPFDLCSRLPKGFEIACIFWQPWWWHQLDKARGLSELEIFAKMGMACSSLDSEESIRACFEGLGNITAFAADFDPAKSAELCDVTSNIQLQRLFCRSVAANSLSVGGAGMKGDGLAVCKGLTASEYTHCASYVRNEVNLLKAWDIPFLNKFQKFIF